MLSLKSFITEGYQSTVLQHLEHPHQLHIQSGAQGFKDAHKFLMDTHKKLSGGRSSVNISRKVDGGVSVIIDHHPKHGVSVSTKSGFNVNPKINKTEEDIDRNHGHAPGLARALKHVLKHASSFVNPGHKVQGDLLYTKGEGHSYSGGKTSFTPNALPMSHPGKPRELGIALHTHYERGVAKAGVPKGATRDVPHVYQHDVSFKSEPARYKQSDRNSFEHHMQKATESHQQLGNYSHHTPEHQTHLTTYLNKTIREKSTPSVDGYKDHLKSVGIKNAAKVSTEAAKGRHLANAQSLSDHVDANSEAFHHTLQVHNHLNQAKEHLIKGHLNPSDEGLVVSSAKGKVKLVPKKVSHALLTNTRFTSNGTV